MQNLQSTPAPVTPVELLERQLRDWLALHDDLSTREDQTVNLNYCWAQAERIKAELSILKQK